MVVLKAAVSAAAILTGAGGAAALVAAADADVFLAFMAEGMLILTGSDDSRERYCLIYSSRIFNFFFC